MEARPFQVSLRVRHPAIDPEEISAALGLEAEHCFRAGDPRTGDKSGRRTSHHTQTYWLAPVTDQSWADPIEPASVLSFRSVDTLLLGCLRHLNARHAFLERIQREGGDVSLLIAVARDSSGDFVLPATMMRLLVKLGISLEFKFDA